VFPSEWAVSLTATSWGLPSALKLLGARICADISEPGMIQAMDAHPTETTDERDL